MPTKQEISELSKMTKETTSFSEFREGLKAWMMEHSGFSGKEEIESFLQESESELRECYRDGLSVVGTEVSLLSGL